MHNLYARFVKILEICKKIGKDLVNKEGNIPRRGVVPKFSDLEVLSLSMTSESLGIDSEAYLFSILKGYKKEWSFVTLGEEFKINFILSSLSPALPNIILLIFLILLTVPSNIPLLKGNSTALAIASKSSSTILQKSEHSFIFKFRTSLIHICSVCVNGYPFIMSLNSLHKIISFR